MEDFKSIITKEVSGLPVWVWLLVIIVGLGIGVLIHKKSSDKDTDDKKNEKQSNSAQVGDNYPVGDSLEGGFPIAASQTNTSLPYAGLPANTYALINQGGLSGIPMDMMLGSPYPWRFRHGRWYHKRGERHRKHDMREHNLEGHGTQPVAARVGSR